MFPLKITLILSGLLVLIFPMKYLIAYGEWQNKIFLKYALIPESWKKIKLTIPHPFTWVRIFAVGLIALGFFL